MLTLLVLVFFLLLLLAVTSRMARRRRRAFEERAREYADTQGAPGSELDPFGDGLPFGAFPFGTLLESLMTGAGARSFRYDPETGRWVEMSEELPAQSPDAPAPARANGDAPTRPTRRRARTKTRTTSMMGLSAG